MWGGGGAALGAGSSSLPLAAARFPELASLLSAVVHKDFPPPPDLLPLFTLPRPTRLAWQADCLPDPGDVFAFLKENGIGQEHALYYIAFATYLEARGGYAKADAVYQQGINMLAAPVDRLRAKFAEFQQRMVGGWVGGLRVWRQVGLAVAAGMGCRDSWLGDVAGNAVDPQL